MKLRHCVKCNEEYDSDLRKGQPGKITECINCAEETTIKLTGVMLYGHKTGAAIQINTDPALTKYIINSTKLMNKGSNLGNNLKVSGVTKGNGRMHTAGDIVSGRKNI